MAPAEGTILVTGANGGLGSAIARQIAQTLELSSKYHSVFIVRNVDMAITLKDIVNRAPTSFNHDTVSIDLSHLSSIREGAKAINARVADGSLPLIRALILSAGFQELETQAFSSDGFDMTFQVNYLSHFLLVLLLLQSLDKEHGRIVIVAGIMNKRNDVAGIYKDEKYKVLFHNAESLAKGTWSSPAEDPSSLSGQRRYGAAHLCEVMFMHELQKRLNVDPSLSNIAVLGVDPGAMPTDICRRDAFFVRIIEMKVIFPIINPIFVALRPNGFLRTPAKSATDVLRAAFDTETLGDRPKDLYFNGTEHWPTSKEAKDEKNREALWKDSLLYANIVEGDTVLVQCL